jgi:hypothetical protein
MQSGGFRECTRSIQTPDRSVSTSILASVANHSVANWPARSGRTIEPVAANDRSHGRVAGELLGVADILVAGEPTEHHWAEQSAQFVVPHKLPQQVIKPTCSTG